MLAAGLVTGLGITALNTAATTLPILAFAAPSPSPSSYFSATNSMIPTFNYRYTDAGKFSSIRGTGIVYALRAPADGAIVLEHVASVLKIDIGVPHPSKNSTSWVSSSALYSAWLHQRGGFDSWVILRTAPLSPAGSSPVLATHHLQLLALSFAQQLGTYPFGPATIVREPPASGTFEDVTLPITVNGQPTNLPFTFGFQSDGTVTRASGESFSVRPAGSYPLLSLAAGVAEIPAQQYVTSMMVDAAGALTVYGNVAATSSPTRAPPPGVAQSTRPPLTPSPQRPSTTSIGAPPTTVVATVVPLTSATEQYGAFTLANGTSLLLPLYLYSAQSQGATSDALGARIIAIDPMYLHFK